MNERTASGSGRLSFLFCVRGCHLLRQRLLQGLSAALAPPEDGLPEPTEPASRWYERRVRVGGNGRMSSPPAGPLTPSPMLIRLGCWSSLETVHACGGYCTSRSEFFFVLLGIMIQLVSPSQQEISWSCGHRGLLTRGHLGWFFSRFVTIFRDVHFRTFVEEDA